VVEPEPDDGEDVERLVCPAALSPLNVYRRCPASVTYSVPPVRVI
jgi:hypothetical protein